MDSCFDVVVGGVVVVVVGWDLDLVGDVWDLIFCYRHETTLRHIYLSSHLLISVHNLI